MSRLFCTNLSLEQIIFYEQNHFVLGKQFCFFIMLMCICIVGFHWMKTDFICRQNGVILISRLTCYVRWEIGVEGQDWKLFDMHMVGYFHMLMQPARLTFSPSRCNYAGGKRVAVCQPVPHPSLHPSSLSGLPFIFPLLLFLSSSHFYLVSALSTSASSKAPESFRLLGAAPISSASSRWCRTSSALTADTNIHSNTLHSCHLHASQPCHWLWNRLKTL